MGLFHKINCDINEQGITNINSNIEANKNVLTILKIEDSPYLESDYVFEYNTGEYNKIYWFWYRTLIPEKVLYTNTDESIYVNVKSIE